VLAQAEAREVVVEQAVFVLRRVEGWAAVAAVEWVAQRPAPGDREVRRLGGVAGRAAFPDPAAGREPACRPLAAFRPSAAQRLARGEFRPQQAPKATIGDALWQPELRCRY